jgi:hypothetical protein
MQNVTIVSNLNCIKKRLKGWVHNYTFLVLNAFHHVQTAFNAILSKYNPNKSSKSPTCDSTEYQISPFQVLKSNKVHIRKTNLKVEASEKIYFIESDYQNRTRSSILERSICLEMNKTEFLSEGSE